MSSVLYLITSAILTAMTIDGENTMHDAFYIGATGLQAQQRNIDAIANNVSNVSTPAYKRTRVRFADLMGSAAPASHSTATLAMPTGDPQTGLAPAAAVAGMKGLGVGVVAMEKLFDPGELRKTDSAMDLAVAGDGFLEVSLPDGSSAYVRGATLKVGPDGALATQAGYPLKPGVVIPPDIETLHIDAQGLVSAQLPERSSPLELGQIPLVRFINAQGLLAQGGNLYRSTAQSGEAIAGKPGEEGLGVLAQGYIEDANVDMSAEMVALMIAQRAYGASLKLLQASDEMMGMINNLRK